MNRVILGQVFSEYFGFPYEPFHHNRRNDGRRVKWSLSHPTSPQETKTGEEVKLLPVCDIKRDLLLKIMSDRDLTIVKVWRVSIAILFSLRSVGNSPIRRH